MFFKEIFTLFNQLQKTSLPGVLAHDKVLDTKVRDYIFKDAKYAEPPRKSAVLALVYPDEQGEAKMVFILRKSYNGHHSGQIAFPGGKLEKEDKSLYDTALREANEEVNINPQQVQLIKELTKVFIPVSNYMVQAFLAYSTQIPNFIKDPSEVAGILHFSLNKILNNPLQPIQKEYFGKTYQLHAFKIDEYLIWGATAMILSEIKELFIDVLKTDYK
jgi:8-oxo-dGTP pyrophosphatase MutT (NUDIX family)